MNNTIFVVTVLCNNEEWASLYRYNNH